MTVVRGTRGRAVGPSGGLFLGVTREFMTDPLQFLLRCFQQYGDTVRIRLGPSGIVPDYWLAAHPRDVEHVLKGNQNAYRKSPTYRPIRNFLGDGLLTSDGDTWLRHRRIAQPTFSTRSIDALVPTMVAAAREGLERWDELVGQRVEMADEMSRLTLKVVGDALFSMDLADDSSLVAPALARIQDHIDKRIPQSMFAAVLALSERLPTRENATYRTAVDDLERVVGRIIDRHRASAASDGDLLDHLMAATDEEGSRLDDAELRDEVMTFLLAGHETTANALSWALFLLGHHPAERSRLEAEADTVLGGALPTAQTVAQLPVTTAVVKEAMRLYPPVWVVERQAITPDRVGDHDIDEGAIVAMSPFVTHRHPGFWAEPHEFRPSRFLEPEPAPAHHFAYFPFGGGRRQCIGGAFAMVEATLLLAMLSARYRLDVEDGEARTDPKITLRPLGGLPMTLHRR